MSNQHRNKKERWLYWMPRCLAIFLILFLALFAFDVFTPERSIPEMIGAFLIHLIPNFLLVIALLFAWKKELYGGIIFILISVLVTLFFHTYQMLSSFLIITLPVFVIGVLFVMHQRYTQ